jgi:adenine deaminase
VVVEVIMKSTGSVSDVTGKDTLRLMRVALGQQPGDLAVVNARVLNVYTGELLERQSVVACDRWIAYAGEHNAGMIGPATEVIDAAGKVVIPGLIDGHTHLAGFYNATEFIKHAAPGGTTTIITEAFEPYAAGGYACMVEYLESIADQPIKIYATAPPMVSINKAQTGIDAQDLEQLLARPEILGMGEIYWQGVLQTPELLLATMRTTMAAGKTLEGHSAGARGGKLAAYAATGVSSCHEPITAAEALERLRLGMHVMAREGNVRRDLKAIAEIRHMGVDLRRLTLVSDGIAPGDLLEDGYMETVVQRAIEYGFDPVAAIQMTTLNVAEHFSIDHLVGGIAPGRYADLVIIPDLQTIRAQIVISNGQVIARQGRIVVPPRAHTFSATSRNTIHLPRPMTGADFGIPANGRQGNVDIVVIDMVTDLVTGEQSMSLPVHDGRIKCDPARDLVKVAVVDRRHTPGKTFTALIHGFHLHSGAFATSLAWDTSNMIVVGADEAAMAQCINRIKALQGGIVVADGGAILAELALPVFGTLSDLPMEELAERLTRINEAIKRLGVLFPDPLLTLGTLTGAAIPYLRICEEGLVQIKTGRLLENLVG